MGPVASPLEVHNYVRQHVGEVELPLQMPTMEEASPALLRAKTGYDIGDSNVAPYKPGLVALPDDLSGAPLLEEVVLERVRRYLERNYADTLRGYAEFLQLEDHAPPVRPYMDVVLERSTA